MNVADLIIGGTTGVAILIALLMLRVAFHDFWDEDD